MNDSKQAIKKISFWFGLIIFLFISFGDFTSSLNSEAWAVLSIMLLMMVWWFFEVIPIYVTALLPLILIPLLTNQNFHEIAAPYASPSIFYF